MFHSSPAWSLLKGIYYTELSKSLKLEVSLSLLFSLVIKKIFVEVFSLLETLRWVSLIYHKGQQPMIERMINFSIEWATFFFFELYFMNCNWDLTICVFGKWIYTCIGNNLWNYMQSVLHWIKIKLYAIFFTRRTWELGFECGKNFATFSLLIKTKFSYHHAPLMQ